MELHYCVPVWGERYVSVLTDVSMPSLLAEGNLPALAEVCDVRFRIFTRSADAELIRSSPIWRRFSDRIRTDIVPCDHLDLSQTYGGMSNLLREAIRQAAAAGAAFVPQAADGFWSDGSFRTLGRLLRAGKRLVLCGGVRVTMESFVPAILRDHVRPDGSVALSGQELVGLAIDHMHPSFASSLADGRLRPEAPSHWLRPCGERSFIQTIFHAVPLVVVGTGYECGFNGTIDRGFVETLGLAETEIAMIGSSDDLMLVDIARARRFLGRARLDPASDAVVTGRWFHEQGEQHALHGGRFLARAIRCRGSDRPGEAADLARAARQSRRAAMDGLAVAEMLAAARALRQVGRTDLGAELTAAALGGRLSLSVARLRPYRAFLPAGAAELRLLLSGTGAERLADRILPGIGAAAGVGIMEGRSLGGGLLPALQVVGGPVDTGLGQLYLVDR